MSKVFIEESSLAAIGDAIRSKTSGEELLSPAEMAEAIAGIETGGGGFWDEETVKAMMEKTIVSATIPEDTVKIGLHAFRACTKLETINFPAALAIIDQYAFAGCSKLVVSEFPAAITTINSNAFQNCTSLISITFKGAPTSIAANAFTGCSNLTEIKVPWAEDEVANAPWGATNATITYNYTEEE